MEWLYPYIATIGVNGKHSPSFAMNDSKTRRSPHKGTESHQKISIFSESSQLYGVAPDESTETGRQQRESFTKPKWKNYDSTIFWSRIITSRYIAVKWYLRVYWLLPLSIVASFKKNRRFFCLAPSILLPSTVDSFGKHRRLFCWAPWILCSLTEKVDYFESYL